MPNGFASLDNGMPDLSRYDTTEKKLQAVQDYLVQLLEQLRYTLNNISADNFNEHEVAQFVGGVVDEPIKIAVENAEEEMRGEIDIAADEIRLDVKGTLADEWVVGKNYYLNDVVKVTGTNSVSFYKAKNLTPHTSTNNDKPGSGTQWATYWDAVSEPTVQSVIDLNLNGITLAYDNDEVGSGDHNATYITLNKDGIEMGGGLVKIKNLDASTITAGSIDASQIEVKNINASKITTGTLDASAVIVENLDADNITAGTLSADYISGGNLNAGGITLRNSFTVQYKDNNDEYHSCGSIGGDDGNGGTVWMSSLSTNNYIYVNDSEVSLISLEGGGLRSIDIGTDDVQITCSKRVSGVLQSKTLIVDHTGIYIKDGSSAKKDLFSLF